MAIYHLSAKAIQRKKGHSATAHAAYRAGEKIFDERTMSWHDYTAKGGVVGAHILLPEGAGEWARDRAALWNAAELAEKRSDSCVGREIEVALPAELDADERRALALEFGKYLTERGCAVDIAIHEPSKDGDDKNHHAHIMMTVRNVGENGLGGKLQIEKAGENRKAQLDADRAKWATLVNAYLEKNKINTERVDHRSYEARGINKTPSRHRGPALNNFLCKVKKTAKKLDDLVRELKRRFEERERKHQDQVAVKAAMDGFFKSMGSQTAGRKMKR